METRVPRNSNDLTFPLRLRRAAAAARSGIRMYWETAVIAAATGIVALAAALPVASVVRLSPSGLVPRLELASSRIADLGLVWASTIHTPADTQRMALAQLFLGLESAAIAALVVGGLTILAVSGARASQRGSEVAVRRAVGASRRGLLSAAFLEGGVVAGAALVLGGIAGAVATAWAVRSWDGPTGPAGIVPAAAVMVLVAVALLLGVLFSLVFARSRRVAAPSGPPLQLYVCALQLGTSLMVLTGSALTVRHASTLLGSFGALGMGRVYQFALPETDPAERANRYAALLTRLESDPSIAQASLTSPGATVGLGTISQVITECGVCPQGGLPLKWSFANVTHHFVSADTFLTVGAQVVEGRGITRLDRWDSARVAVVNRALADHHFEGGKAIGKRIMIHTPGDDWFTVVGIVADPPQTGFGAGFQPANTVYLSVLQRPVKSAELLVRGGAADERVERAIEAAGVRRDAVSSLGERDLVARESAPLRWFGEMLRIEGWAVFLLAVAGTFLLMSLWVRSLWAEIGIHRAVGARRPEVLRRIMWQATKVGLGSVVAGWWLGPSLWELIGQTVVGLPSWDTGLFVRFSILLTAAALAGALIPAFRASRTPAVALLGAGED